MHILICKPGFGTRRLRAKLTLGVAVSILFAGMVASCNEGTTDPTGGLLDRTLKSDASPLNNIGLAHRPPTHGPFGDDTPDGEPADGTFVAGRLLVKFRPGVSEKNKEHTLSSAHARVAGEIQQIGVLILELPPNAGETAQARALGQQADVEFAELDHIYEPAMVPNDPLYSDSGTPEWHLPKIGAPAAWDLTTGSSSVVIAILDSGVFLAHQDFAFKMVPGWNVINNNTDTNDIINGHGTLVAGVAAAASNNGVGVASVAWGCNIMPIVVSNSAGWTTDASLALGLTWAADHGARVANMSFGMLHTSTLLSAAQYFQSIARGVVTMSAGNSGAIDPAPDDPPILDVSATDQNDLLPGWSSNGNCIDLAAPGVNIPTTTSSGGYGADSGTSCSAPLVAGVAALMLSANPSLTPQQVQDILKQSADRVGPYAYNEDPLRPGWNHYYGYGRVNAGRAVQQACALPGSVCTAPTSITGACCTGTTCTATSQAGCTGIGGTYKGDGTACGASTCDTTPPTCSITSPTGGSTVSGTVTVQVSAFDNVGVTFVSLYVDGALLGTDNLSPYSFSWNTASYSNGTHTLQAKATDAAGNVGSSTTISVTVNNTAADPTPPTVTITSPPNGASVNRTLSVYVSTYDAVGVKRVELYVDGVIKSTATIAPFTTTWKTAGRGAHTLQCRAYDAAGNMGSSTVVTVDK